MQATIYNSKKGYTHVMHGTKHVSARQVTAMPWKATGPCPWFTGYERVFIPYTPEEMRNRAHGNQKRGHIQIVRRSHLTSVKYKR